MELLKGGELLFDQIVQREKYSENDAKIVAVSILQTLAHSHDSNIVHRDLKPENLVFDSSGEVATLKLTDFGFATIYSKKRPLNSNVRNSRICRRALLSSLSLFFVLFWLLLFWVVREVTCGCFSFCDWRFLMNFCC